MRKITNTLKYWKSALVTAFILHLSFASPSEFKSIPTFENEDKLIHFLMYLSLTAILIFDSTRLNLSKRIQLVLCLVYPILLGGIVEILQPIYFFPRSASWFDWLADTLGSIAGWYIMTFIHKKFNLNNTASSNK